MPRIIMIVASTALVAALAACGDEPAEIQVQVPVAGPEVVTTTSSATPEIAAPERSVTASYEDGEAAYRAGRYEDASIIFSAYTDAHPANVFGHYMVGLASWKAGEPARALEAFDRALALDSTHIKSLLNSSRVLLDMKQPDEAIARIDRVLQQDSTNVEGLRVLARAYYNQGDHEAAVSAYRRVLSVQERDAWSLNNLGLIRIEQGEYENAIGPLALAVEVRGDSPVFRNNLGSALEGAGYPGAAREQFEAALRVDSTYAKAAASLERVAADSLPGAAIDLGMRASAFVTEVRTWSR